MVRVRTTEMGLIACKTDPQSTGQICSFKPYPDTKKIFETRWIFVDQKLEIELFHMRLPVIHR